MDEPSKAEKTILKNLNNIINTNKNYFESLRFKLITDVKTRKKKFDSIASRPNQQASHCTILAESIVRLNETDYELKLPCFIVQDAFAEFELSSDRKLSRNSRENYLFIRKLIGEHKSFFIRSINKMLETEPQPPQTFDGKIPTENNLTEFASHIITDLISEIVETSPKRIQHDYQICHSYSESLINELFKELKLNVPSLPYTTNTKYQPELPDFVIDRASDLNVSTDDDLETEGREIFDDLSSLNSSAGSHCRHLFVHNFLVKRRHSADVIRVNDNNYRFANNDIPPQLIFCDSHEDNTIDCPIINSSTRKNSKQHQLPVQFLPRRHSINSLSLSYRHINKLNDELAKLDNLRFTFIELGPTQHTQPPIILRHQETNKTLPLKSRRKKLRTRQLNIGNNLKKIMFRTAHTRQKSMHSFEDIAEMTKQSDLGLLVGGRWSSSVKYADELIREMWEESMDTIVSVVRNVKNIYAEDLVEDVFKEAFEDIQAISTTIKKSDRFYFKCKCTSSKHKSLYSTSPASNNKTNINCLLAVYCMMIALAECHLQNQITFICPHFG